MLELNGLVELVFPAESCGDHLWDVVEVYVYGTSNCTRCSDGWPFMVCFIGAIRGSVRFTDFLFCWCFFNMNQHS